MEEIEIPSYFICPISMQLMRDPVTVATGITYDRESIERWIFSMKNNICPVTKQELSANDPDLITPNHTLRRLIQSWCTLHSAQGIERIPTPKPPVEKSQIVKLLNEAKKSPQAELKCLMRLRSIVHHGSESNKKCIESAGGVQILASMIKKNEGCLPAGSDQLYHSDGIFIKTSDEALNILCSLNASDGDLKKLISEENNEFLDSILHILRFGNCPSRVNAIMLLKSLLKVADPAWLIGLKPRLFAEIVRVLVDKISQQTSKAALKLLLEACPWGRNRIKAVEAGAVPVLIELLLDTSEKRATELILTVMDQLCGCAEGRAELVKHEASLAVISKKILRVSQVASDRGVRIISAIARFSPTKRVLQEMLQVGVVAKLCLVVQVDNSHKTKDRAKEILKLHSKVWRESSCIPPHLLSSYPYHSSIIL